uniref:Uncharacterized protein n=1 Tax=Nelumbo nucifera TaxID=4432 RepID=A0A822Z3W1_NELNU|nr:TPA_asm: hypothetical protein HUJ06_014055 [Nelumbo nucifera]
MTANQRHDGLLQITILNISSSRSLMVCLIAATGKGK